MQQNLGSVDRYFRLVTGLVSLSCAARRRQSPMSKAFLLSFGAMKVAEGVIGWCPMQYASEILTDRNDKRSSSPDHNMHSSEGSSHQHRDTRIERTDPNQANRSRGHDSKSDTHSDDDNHYRHSQSH
ncbi:YgaP family membrane protein [Alicyclobacillus dauci]|uniref:YgaP family membrane protein n=1 Tax=Alicyclobacillus dauci TaxID=1475485 RepID=UPI0038995400